MRRLGVWALVILAAALASGCAGGKKTGALAQRLNIPYDNNTVGAELGVWPGKELDLYVQWVTPRLVGERILAVADESQRQRLTSLLRDYIVVRVVAVNHRPAESHFFEYDRWSLLVGGEERRAVVPSGERPTAERGYFSGSVNARLNRTGWVLFPRSEPGQSSANIIYDFGEKRITFSFPPILRR